MGVPEVLERARDAAEELVQRAADALPDGVAVGLYDATGAVEGVVRKHVAPVARRAVAHPELLGNPLTAVGEAAAGHIGGQVGQRIQGEAPEGGEPNHGRRILGEFVAGAVALGLGLLVRNRGHLRLPGRH